MTEIDLKDFGHAVDPVKFFKENQDAIVHISVKSLLELETKRFGEGKKEGQILGELKGFEQGIEQGRQDVFRELDFRLKNLIENSEENKDGGKGLFQQWDLPHFIKDLKWTVEDMKKTKGE